MASSSVFGVVKPHGTDFSIDSDGTLLLKGATVNDIKTGSGTSWRKAVIVNTQHAAAFYGLAKAAGDTTQSQSSNAVGVYTDEAKTAIKSMLGVNEGIEVVRLA